MSPMDPTAFYLVVDMIASVVAYSPPSAVVGPLMEPECRRLAQVIQRENAPSIAAVQCLRPMVWRTCELPGKPSSGAVCPAWDHGPLVGGGRGAR